MIPKLHNFVEGILNDANNSVDNPVILRLPNQHRKLSACCWSCRSTKIGELYRNFTDNEHKLWINFVYSRDSRFHETMDEYSYSNIMCSILRVTIVICRTLRRIILFGLSNGSKKQCNAMFCPLSPFSIVFFQHGSKKQTICIWTSGRWLRRFCWRRWIYSSTTKFW